MLKLYHESNLVGRIPDFCANGFEMHGLVELTEKAADYKPVLDYWASDDKDPAVEPPFPHALFENWFVEDEEGAKRNIGIPDIYTNEGRLEILWRYF